MESAEFRLVVGKVSLPRPFPSRTDLTSSTYAPLTKDTLIAFYSIDGPKRTIVIDVKSGDHTDPGFPANHVVFNALKCTSDTSFAVIDSTTTAPQSLFHFDITQPFKIQVLKDSMDVKFPPTIFRAGTKYKIPTQTWSRRGICLWHFPSANESGICRL